MGLERGDCRTVVIRRDVEGQQEGSREKGCEAAVVWKVRRCGRQQVDSWGGGCGAAVMWDMGGVRDNGVSSGERVAAKQR